MSYQKFAQSGHSGSNNVQGFKSQFSSIEEFNAAIPGWDLDFRQLAAGPVAPEIDAIVGEDLIVNKVSINQHISQLGAAPPGMRTFALLAPSCHEIQWCGHRICSSTFEEFSAGAEFDCHSDGTFEVHTLSVAVERLQAAAETQNVVIPDSNFNVFEPTLSLLRQIRTHADGLLHMKSATNDSVTRMMTGLSSDLDCLLVEAIGGRGSAPRLNPLSREAVRRRALDYLYQHQRDAVSIGELCKHIGTSWRQLDYAFKEHFGMGPKAYHQHIRLHGLHRDLVHAGTSASVTRLAAAWGFTHFGQLAKDYKVLFGETPSATLQNH